MGAIQDFLGEPQGGVLVLENPALPPTVGFENLLSQIPELGGHCLFRTSGTGGSPKFVALSRGALLNSAEVVNRRFSVTGEDRWLMAIPEFHVGGFGILARAHLAGCAVDSLGGNWDAAKFCQEAERLGSTLCSLVPAQVFDLAQAGVQAPKLLRVAMVGGGELDQNLWREARELGWPIVETFGMTETGSQMAVSAERAGLYSPAEGWDVRPGREGVLEVRGGGLFTGYVRESAGRFEFEDPKDGEGWFTTSDRVKISREGFRFVGRVSSDVKVLGELVNLDDLQSRIESLVDSLGLFRMDFLVVSAPDERRGRELILATSAGVETAELVRLKVNRRLAGFERLQRVMGVGDIPRSALGKPLRSEVEKRIPKS